MIVLDTNVLSETMRPSPAAEVLRWMAGHPASQLFTTTITQAEILYGLELMPRGKRHDSLKSLIEMMFEEDFSSRVLPFDGDAARVFAKIVTSRRKLGRPISQLDAQIAAISRSRGALLATRNIEDFENCAITLVNPWSA
jgi:predicted nucleic acid-binding protein